MLAVAANDLYLPGAALTVLSALKRLPDGYRVDVAVFDQGLSDRSRRALQRIVDRAGTRSALRFFGGIEASALGLPEVSHFGSAAYARLLVPELLASAQRVVYLDADTLVMGNLSELFRLDLAGAPGACAVDTKQPTVAEGLAYSFNHLGRGPGEPYFNSGVMIIDPQCWRANDAATRIMAFLREWNVVTLFPDQDGINGVLGPDLLTLGPEWNYQVHFEVETASASAVLGAARIVHFTGVKPWRSLRWLRLSGPLRQSSLLWWKDCLGTSLLSPGLKVRMLGGLAPEAAQVLRLRLQRSLTRLGAKTRR